MLRQFLGTAGLIVKATEAAAASPPGGRRWVVGHNVTVSWRRLLAAHGSVSILANRKRKLQTTATSPFSEPPRGNCFSAHLLFNRFGMWKVSARRSDVLLSQIFSPPSLFWSQFNWLTNAPGCVQQRHVHELFSTAKSNRLSKHSGTGPVFPQSVNRKQ